MASFIIKIKKFALTSLYLYRDFFELAESGIWWLWHSDRFYKKLFASGIRDVQPLNRDDWHLNYRYHTAEFNGEKVFIKSAPYYAINNELVARDSINYHDSFRVPKVYASFLASSAGPANFIVMEMIDTEATKINEAELSHEDRRSIVKALLHFCSLAKDCRLVHRDLNPSNCYWSKKKEVLLITDFAMAIGPGLLEPEHFGRKFLVTRSLGAGYVPSPGVWDDFYAARRIAADLGVHISVET